MFYLACGKFDECLKNIQWARENGYPANKLSKLQEREDKCIEKKAKVVHDSEEDPLNYFKLSHPANPKIPFIADCLEYRDGVMYTTRDLKAGDFIAFEPAGYSFMYGSAQYTRCCLCMKTAMSNCIPCLKNASLMYCSEECRDKTYKDIKDLRGMINFDSSHVFNFEKGLRYAEDACGGRGKLKAWLKQINFQKLTKTVFDFDFSGDPNSLEYKKNMLQCILSLKTSFRKDLEWRFHHEPTHYTNDVLIQKFLEHFASVFDRNKTYNSNEIHDIGQIVEGLFIFPFMRLFKHACNNNIGRIQSDTTMIFFAAVPVKAGQELFINLK